MASNMSRRGWLAAAAASAPLIAGRSAPAQGRKDKVVIGALRFTSHAAGFIALEKGYFAEEDFDVTFSFFQSAQPIAVAVASGDCDFGVAGVTGGLMNLARKNAIRVVAGVLQEKPGVDGMMIMASNKAYDAGLDSVPKIAGHSVAMSQIGSTFHYATSCVAKKCGIDMASLRMLPLQSVGGMVAALRSGVADVMIMVPDIAKPIVEASGARKLGWLCDYSEYQVSTLFSNVANVTKRPELVRRFIRAFARGIADFDRVMLSDKADPAERESMSRMIAKYVAPDMPFARANSAIVSGAMYLNEGAAVNLTDIAEQVQWFQQERLVDFSLSMDQLVDGSFVRSF